MAKTFTFEEASAPSTFTFEEALGPAGGADAGLIQSARSAPMLYGEDPINGPMQPQSSMPVGQSTASVSVGDQSKAGVIDRAVGEGAQLRDEFFSGVDQGAASVKNVNVAIQANRLIETQARLKEMEGRGRGNSAAARRLRQEVESLQSRLPRTAGIAAEANQTAARGSAMATREAVQRVGQAKTFSEAWERFKEAPYDVIAGVTAQSMPQMLPGLIAATLAGPVQGAIIMGASSGVTEFGSSLGDFARDAGVNTSDAQAVQAFYSDPAKLSEALTYAGKRAGIIGTMDAASGGIASKTLAPAAIRSKIGKQAVNLPAQMGVQAGMGGAGDAGAQLATKGEIDKPGEVFLEMAGELGGAPTEVMAFGREVAAAKRTPNDQAPPSAEQMARDRGFLTPAVPDPVATVQSATSIDGAITAAARAVDAAFDARDSQQAKSEQAVANIARIMGMEIPDVGTAAAVPGVVEPAAGGGAPDGAPGVGAGVGAAGPAGQPVDTGGVGGQPAGGAVSLGAGQPGALNFAQPPGPVRQITVTPAGTLTAIGDPKALVRLLKSAGVTNVIPATNGITVGKSQASMARQVLDDFVAAPPENFEQDFQQELEREYQADIKAQLLAKRNPQPVKVEKKTQSPLRTMLRTVGIKPELAADITGERNKVRANNVLPFTFRKNGAQIDELVRIARERGFLTQDEDDVAAGRRLVEMIQADLRGERQESTETIEDAMRGEQDAEIARAAARLGLDTSGMDARQVGNAVSRIERRLARARADGIRREAQAEARIEREAIQAADRRAAGPDRVLDDLDDVPENATLEDAMRALGFTEQEITDAVAQESRRAQADRAGSGGAVAPAAGPAQGGDRRGEGQARQEAGGAEGRPQDLLGEVPNASQQAAARLRAEREEQDRRRQQAAPEAGGFMLSGSDRARDVGAAAGQGDLLAGADAAPAQQAEPSAPAEPDYLAELFGTPAQQAAAQAKFTADAEEKKRGMARVRDAIAEQKKRAATEYDEWAGKVYKQNKTQVDLRGDGPSNQASMSIGAINESRRRNAMEALSQEMRALDKLADEVSTDSGAERVQAILSRLYEQAAKIAADGTGLFKTADEQFQYMLLDDLKFRGPSGKGNVTSNSLSKAMLSAIKPSTPAPAEPAPPEQQEGSSRKGAKAAKIEDFGQKLEGARKDYAATLKDAEAVDIAAEPLSKSWPEPDYDKLLAGGADPYVVAFVHAARDEVPTKPQKGWKLKGWVETVKMLREMSAKLLSGATSKQTFDTVLARAEFASLRNAVGSRAELYQLVGHAKSLKGVTFSEHHYTIYKGQRNVRKWAVEQKAKATAFGNWPRELAVADTKAEMLEQFKAKMASSLPEGDKAKAAKGQFIIYRKRNQDGAFIGKKIGREYIDLKKLPDVAAARAYLDSNAADLLAALERYKDTPFERNPENRPRVGGDHRNGAAVTPEVFAETFGFRGVQFGNYVEQDRRQSDLNQTFDALMDMAAVLGVPPRALSLNGRLGLAFGARGKGGKNAPAAHYEPDTVVINLTKGNGPGSLGHEWWHAVDNYFGKEFGAGGFATDGARVDRLRAEMQAAFKAVRTATQAPTLRRRAAELDKRRSKPYWNTPLELSARAFESYLIAKLNDQGAANDYLANVVDEKVWNLSEEARATFFGGQAVETYPYPGQAELPDVRAAFDEFFKVVETREDDAGNVAMYARSEPALAGGMPLFGREDRTPAGPSFDEARARINEMKGADIDQVREIVDGIRKGWKGGPAVQVVASYLDLPGRPIPGARGMYIGGKVYVVASSHRAGGNLRQAVAKTLSHEVIAHYGLRKILGADFDRLLTKPMQLALASGNKPLNALRDQVRRLYVDDDGNYTLSKREEADEIAARAVENAIDADGNFRPGYAWLKSVWARVAQFLRDRGIDVPFTQAELQGMLVQAQQAVRDGERLAGASTVVVTQQPVLSRRSAEDVAPAEGFWSKIKAGKSFTPQEIADAYARGVRGTVRAFAGFSGEKGGMAAVPGTEHAGWRDEIAGFDGYVTVGVSFADGSLAMGVIPRELYPGRGSALGLGDLGEYSLATYAFTPNPDGSYRLDVFDPRRGGRVFDELARRGRLEETGDTDVAGQPYYRAVFDNRYTTSHSLIQEAVRRLGYHLGAVPTVVQIGRDTGSRANPGKEQVRTFTPEFIERRLARGEPRDTTAPVANPEDVAGNDSGRPAGDTSPVVEPNRTIEPFLVNMAPALATAMRRWEAGKATEEELAAAVRAELDDRKAKRENATYRDRVRGSDWLQERILRARRTGEMSTAEADLALWLLNQAPQVATDLGISIKSGDMTKPNGTYNVLERVVTIFTSKSNPDTLTHEILHHTERMMPEQVQNAIRKEWLKQLEAESKKVRAGLERRIAKSEADPRLKQAVGADQQRIVLLDWMLEAARKGDADLASSLYGGFRDGISLRNVLPYELSSPSEFWAVNAASLVRKRAEAGTSLWRQARQWLVELMQKAKYLLGLRSNAPVIHGLEAVLAGDGSFVTRGMISTGARELNDQTDTPAFRKWFGESVVTDNGKPMSEGGRPLVVYHGTDSVFTEFSRTGDIGYHFGTEIAARDRAARVGGAEVLVEPVTLSQVEKDSLSSLNGEIGGTPAADLYALLLRKLDSPRQNLRAQVEAMPADEIKKVKAEYLEQPDSLRFAERVDRAKAGEGFRVEVNGETVSTHRTVREANARAARLRERAATPMALYLRIENPIRLPDLGVWPAQEIAKEAGFSKREMERVVEAGTAEQQYEAVRAILESKGFDGIVYRNEVEHAGEDSYIAFRPEQIKSAIGNSGAFDPTNPDIRYALGEDGLGAAEEAAGLIAGYRSQFGGKPPSGMSKDEFWSWSDRRHDAETELARQVAELAQKADNMLVLPLRYNPRTLVALHPDTKKAGALRLTYFVADSFEPSGHEEYSTPEQAASAWASLVDPNGERPLFALAADDDFDANHVARPRSRWLDDAGRLRFLPGTVVYDLLGKAATPLLNRAYLKTQSKPLRRAIREMKLTVQKAQDTAEEIGREVVKLTDAEREMVSDIIEKELATGVIPPEHAVKLAATMNEVLGKQSDELVELGMLASDTAEQWRGKYLARYYKDKLGARVQSAWDKAISTFGAKPMRGLRGNHFKGRGLYETIPESELPAWEANGWEVRDPDYQEGITNDGTVRIWRDFTRAEREKMGEIRDAGFRFVMGYMETQKDIALGRMFQAIAADPELSSKYQTEELSEQVPDGTISGTGVKKYGKLAGRWVSKETISHLSQIEESQSEAFKMYRKAMGLWKEGKALAIDTPIPTPTGWTTMGDVQEGDTVFDEQGKPCRVTYATGVQMDRACYEVEFSDGAKIVADEEHLWFTVYHSKGSVKTTKQILDTLKERTRGDNNHSIPVAGALQTPDVDLPIPPYALGAWLGDGTSSSASMCAGPKDADEIAQHVRDSGLTVGAYSIDKRNGVVTFGLRYSDASLPRSAGLQPTMRRMGLLNNKHIPAIYLRASERQRRELLCGLMDTDGHICESGKPAFSTTLPQLRDGFLELTRSLGYKPTCVVSRAMVKGKDCGETYRIQFTSYSDDPVFKMDRKLERMRERPETRQRSGTRQIVAIRPVPSVPVKCIQVDSESRLYLAGASMIPTHNTSLNPVAHANNIVSNITMAHFAGVSYWDVHKYAKAMRDFAMKSDSVKEAKDAGLFLGTVSDAELMNVLPEDLKAIVRQQEGALTKVGSNAFNAMTWFLRRPMGAAYQAEDTFFRYLIWKDARDQGMSAEDAVDYSLRYIFAYDDLPLRARQIRDFMIPFFAYTYKAIPALLHTAANYPWRFAAPAAVMWGINAAAYAIAVGDDDDDWIERLQKYLTDPAYREKARAKEKMEREYLPEWMKGETIMNTPKAIRLGMDEVTKLPLFIDVYRMVPGGDMLDMNNNAGGTPWLQPFTPNHPLLTTYMAMFGNRDGWTGKDVVDKTDDSTEAAQKRLGWLWRQTAPALAYGNYHFERTMQALAQATGKPVQWAPEFMGGMEATGVGKDGLPVQPKYAAMQTFGLKVRPIDVEMGEIYDNAAKNKLIREIDAEMRRLGRLNAKGAVSDAAFDREAQKANVKRDRLNDGLTIDGKPKN